MKPLRVMQIISGFAVEGPLGGIERFGIELSRSLANTTIDNTLVGLWSYNQPTERNWMQVVRDSGSHVWMGPLYDFDKPYQSFQECYRACKEHFRGQRFDVIHSHCQFGDLLALMLAPQFGANVKLRTVHNEREWWRRPLRRIMLTNLLYPLLFQGEVGVSQNVVDNLDTRLGSRLIKRQAVRIHNAVNLMRFVRIDSVTDVRDKYGIPQDAVLVGSVGRLTEQKGYSILVTAAQQLIASGIDAYFMVVGDGELHAALVRQVQDAELLDRVIFTGALSNIETVLWNWDLFVSSSLWEGLPTVILESMAAGIPVVATEVSGTLELIQHEINGLLVKPNQPATLAEAIQRIIEDPELGNTLATKAKEMVQAFSINNIAQQYVELYTEHCNMPKNP